MPNPHRGGGDPCVAAGCPNHSRRDKNLRFFRFPKEEIRCKIWIKNCGRPELLQLDSETCYKRYRLCSLHFENDMYWNTERTKLLPLAVPTIFARNSAADAVSFEDVIEYFAIPVKREAPTEISCAFCCRNKISSEQLGVTFHNFPEDIVLKNAWIEACVSRGVKLDENINNFKLCSDHFTLNDYEESPSNRVRTFLKTTAVPTRFWRKPHVHCIACSDIGSANSDIYLHRFPYDSILREKWSDACRLNGFNIKNVLSQYALCSKHFPLNCFSANDKRKKYLERDAVPSIFSLPTSSEQQCENLSINIKFIESTSGVDVNSSSYSVVPCNDTSKCVDNTSAEIPENVKRYQVENLSATLASNRFLGNINNSPTILMVCSSDIQLNTGSVDNMDETAVNEIKNENFEEIYIKEEPLEEIDHKVQDVIVNGIKKEDCSLEEEEKCTDVLEIADHLNEHKKISDTSSEEFQCSLCQQMFTQQHNLENHMKIHDEIKTFQCFIGVCQKQFTNKSDFECHIKTHDETNDEANKLQCLICRKLFKQRHGLKEHQKIHSGIKEFECHICNKLFCRKSDLNIHVKIHSGIKDFRCTICQKSFTQRSNLNMHIKTHNPVKEFKCNVCHKLFARKENLLMHSKIHTGKDFQCGICKRLFVRKQHLSRHIKGKHGEVKEENLSFSQTHTHTDNVDVNVDTSSDTGNCIFIKEEAHSDTELSEELKYI